MVKKNNDFRTRFSIILRCLCYSTTFGASFTLATPRSALPTNTSQDLSSRNDTGNLRNGNTPLLQYHRYSSSPSTPGTSSVESTVPVIGSSYGHVITASPSLAPPTKENLKHIYTVEHTFLLSTSPSQTPSIEGSLSDTPSQTETLDYRIHGVVGIDYSGSSSEYSKFSATEGSHSYSELTTSKPIAKNNEISSVVGFSPGLEKPFLNLNNEEDSISAIGNELDSPSSFISSEEYITDTEFDRSTSTIIKSDITSVISSCLLCETLTNTESGFNSTSSTSSVTKPSNVLSVISTTSASSETNSTLLNYLTSHNPSPTYSINTSYRFETDKVSKDWESFEDVQSLKTSTERVNSYFLTADNQGNYTTYDASLYNNSTSSSLPDSININFTYYEYKSESNNTESTLYQNPSSSSINIGFYSLENTLNNGTFSNLNTPIVNHLSYKNETNSSKSISSTIPINSERTNPEMTTTLSENENKIKSLKWHAHSTGHYITHAPSLLSTVSSPYADKLINKTKDTHYGFSEPRDNRTKFGNYITKDKSQSSTSQYSVHLENYDTSSSSNEYSWNSVASKNKYSIGNKSSTNDTADIVIVLKSNENDNVWVPPSPTVELTTSLDTHKTVFSGDQTKPLYKSSLSPVVTTPLARVSQADQRYSSPTEASTSCTQPSSETNENEVQRRITVSNRRPSITSSPHTSSPLQASISSLKNPFSANSAPTFSAEHNLSFNTVPVVDYKTQTTSNAAYVIKYGMKSTTASPPRDSVTWQDLQKIFWYWKPSASRFTTTTSATPWRPSSTEADHVQDNGDVTPTYLEDDASTVTVDFESTTLPLEAGGETQYSVYWNVPTFQCHKYGLNFSRVSDWGMEQNLMDEFRGEAMAILYDPGEFPALLPASGTSKVSRNGGVPQEGSLTRHLALFAAHLDKLIPDRQFSGLGVIDFEHWRPVWRQNWGTLAVYRDYSRHIERRRHPLWFSTMIEMEAKFKYELAARTFVLETLRMAKEMRPNAKWGYYGYPFCFNYTPYNNRATCSYETSRDNDGMDWLFSEVSAHYPSLYLKEKGMYSWKRRRFIEGRLEESLRVAQEVPVFPYVWYKYHDTDQFLSQVDMVEVLRRPMLMGCRGAVIWGASRDVNTRHKCEQLASYLEEVIGPAVLELKTGLRADLYDEVITPLAEGEEEDEDEDEEDEEDLEKKKRKGP